MPSEIWNQWIKAKHGGVLACSLESASTFTHADLMRRAEQEASTLAHLPPGSVIALCEPNSICWLARFLAIQKHQCCALLLDAGLNEPAALDEAYALDGSYLWTETLVPVKPRAPRLPDTALIKLTSGSTGTPKRIFCSPENMIADGRQCASSMNLRPDDRQLGTLPFAHSYALGNLILPLILQGSPLYFCADFTANQINDWIPRHRITVYPTIPVIVRLLTESPSITSLTPLRTLISAGAPLPPSTARAFHHKFGIFVHNFYGSSETGGICYDRSGQAGISGRSVGTPLDGVQVSIDPNKQVRVASAAVADPSGEHLLEDTGKLNEHQELSLSGRVEAWVNIGGKKVRPLEISTKARTLPGVSEVWTGKISRGGREWLKTVIAGPESAETYREQLSKILPAWKVPREIRVMDTLPRNSRGKLERQTLINL